MMENLEDPLYTIPKSEREALNLARNLAANPNAPGYEAYLNNLGQIGAATQVAIDRGATSANQALGATLQAQGQQLKSLNDYQGASDANFVGRQQNLQRELSNMARFEDNKWENDINQAFLRRAMAAQSLVGAGLQNTNAGVSDLSGMAANYYAGTAEERAERKRLEAEKKENDRRALLTQQIKFQPDDYAGNLQPPSGGMLPALYTDSSAQPNEQAMSEWDQWIAEAYGNPVNFQTNNNYGVWPN